MKYLLKNLPKLDTPEHLPRDKVVYLHRRESDGIPFYVGIGVEVRPYIVEGRNNDWTNVYEEHGRTVELLMEGLIQWHAKTIEIILISQYRFNYGKFREGGFITNLSDGGESSEGYQHSEEFKVARSEAQKQNWQNEEYRAKQMSLRQNPEYREKLSAANKIAQNRPEVKAAASARVTGELHPMYGRSHTEDSRRKMSIGQKITQNKPEVKARNREAMTGEKNPMHGVHRYNEHAPSFKGYSVGVNAEQFVIFAGAKEMKAHKFCSGHICSCISGNRPIHKGFTWTRRTVLNPDDFIGLTPFNELSAERLNAAMHRSQS